MSRTVMCAKLGRELHSRLATMGDHVRKLGRNLELATGAYNSFVGSLESQVLTQARRFEALEVSSGAKEIEAMPVVSDEVTITIDLELNRPAMPGTTGAQ